MSACLAGCSGSGSGTPRQPAQAGDTRPAAGFRDRVYERAFVFTTLRGDSSFLVPWLMSARMRQGAVERETRGLLVRGGTWDEFYSEKWETPPSRSPWRILPHDGLHLVVGMGDAVESLVFEDGRRSLELDLGDVLQEWTGPRDESFRIQEGAALLAGRRVDGVVLDLFRERRTDDPDAGDWAFVISGDSLQALMEAPRMTPPGTVGAWHAWARLGLRDLQWPAVTVEWTELRAFQPSRQDVPVAWSISSDGDALSGALDVTSARIRSGTGPGPVLPVDALFQVTGTLRIEGGRYPVRGLLRHRRP